jgi:hypothetical protein
VVLTQGLDDEDREFPPGEKSDQAVGCVMNYIWVDGTAREVTAT